MSASRSDIDVLRVARRARLSLDPAEAESFRVQITRVLEHIAQLDEVDITDVAPTQHGLQSASPMRDDTPVVGLPRDEALGGAASADREQGAFVVPRFVEGG